MEMFLFLFLFFHSIAGDSGRHSICNRDRQFESPFQYISWAVILPTSTVSRTRSSSQAHFFMNQLTIYLPCFHSSFQIVLIVLSIALAVMSLYDITFATRPGGDPTAAVAMSTAPATTFNNPGFREVRPTNGNETRLLFFTSELNWDYDFRCIWCNFGYRFIRSAICGRLNKWSWQFDVHEHHRDERIEWIDIRWVSNPFTIAIEFEEAPTERWSGHPESRLLRFKSVTANATQCQRQKGSHTNA